MTTAAPEPKTPTPQPSDLMAIVLAYKSGEADWSTTKEALLHFPYVASAEPAPDISDPAYGEWYNKDGAYPPNSFGELTEAAFAGRLEMDRFDELCAAMDTK